MSKNVTDYFLVHQLSSVCAEDDSDINGGNTDFYNYLEINV